MLAGLEISQDFGEIFKAMIEASAEVEKAAKSSRNPHLKNDYSDLNDIMDVIKAPLLKNGLAVFQPIFTDDNGVLYVKTLLVHKSGQFMASNKRVKLSDTATPQQEGSAITYARRYSLKAFFNIGDKDDDGNSASGVSAYDKIRNATSLNDLQFIIKGLNPKEIAANDALINQMRVNFGMTPQQIQEVKAMTRQQIPQQPQQMQYPQQQQNFNNSNNR